MYKRQTRHWVKPNLVFSINLFLSSDYPVKNERYKQNKPLRTVIAFGGFVVY